MTGKPPENENPGFSHLTAEDLRALQAIKRGNDWLRAVLCTLARRGVAFRKQSPERANEILTVLSLLPYFKAGQLWFDLMEWEDFMLEGPPPPVVTTVLDARAFKRLASLFDMIKGLLDGSQSQQKEEAAGPLEAFGRLLNVEISGSIVDDRQLPLLEAGFYLYNDVVLGLYVSALQSGQSLSSLVPPDEDPSAGGTTPPTQSPPNVK